MNIHPTWQDLEWQKFKKTHGFCPLCASYHDLYVDSGLVYCIQNDVGHSGWPADVYQKLCVNPMSFDINQYNDMKFRTLKQRLILTLPTIIEKRTKHDRRIEEQERETQQPQVIVQEVIREVPAAPVRPRFDRTYWSRVSAVLGP